MSESLEQQRSKILTSIHGRRFGLDKDGFAVGAKGLRNQVSNATSGSTGTNLGNSGVHTVVTTTNDTWKLEDPVPGCKVVIGTASASTGLHTISPVAATIISSNGIAGSSIVMNGVGDSVTLEGLSTSQWLLSASRGAPAVSS